MMKHSMRFFSGCRRMAAALAVCVCVLSGCHKHYHYYPKEVEETHAEATLSLSQEKLAFSAEGGWKELIIDCSGEWSIAGSNEWCQPGAIAGKGKTLLKVFVETSTEAAERSVVFTVKAGELSRELTVTQQGVSR